MSKLRKLTQDEKKVIRERERAKYPKIAVNVYIEHYTDVNGEPIVRVYRAQPTEIYPARPKIGV